MRRRSWLLAGVVLVALAAIAVAAANWFPSAREPGYRFVRAWGRSGSEPGQLLQPIGIAIRYPTDVALLPNGSLVVADAYNHRIQVFGHDGAYERKWGGPFATGVPGGFNRWFNVATGVAADSMGNVFVADFYNDRIQKFSEDGTFLAAIGGSGSAPGELDRPTDIAVDRDGNVYVVDFGNDRIQKFAPVGRAERLQRSRSDPG